MKKLIALFLALTLCLSLCSCDSSDKSSSKSTSKIVGEWTITDLAVEPQARWSSSWNDTVQMLSGAFPKIGSTVEFTKEKYEDGYKMISDSAISEYSLISDLKISIGSTVGKYDLSKDTLTIEFEEIATITLEKE